MSRRSRNSPRTTGEETAQKNANINSGLTGNRGESSRRARCRGSGRRASNYRRENGLWAANTKINNNKLKHEEIMSMMDRRSWERRQNRVTDEDIERWVEAEDFERSNRIDMELMEAEMKAASSITRSEAVGNVPSVRPEGIFRGMSVQLNNMATSKVRNRRLDN